MLKTSGYVTSLVQLKFISIKAEKKKKSYTVSKKGRQNDYSFTIYFFLIHNEPFIPNDSK